MIAAAVALMLAAAAPPAPAPWEARVVRPAAVEVAARSYVVQPGDPLSRVVVRTGAGANVIALTNGLTAPFALRPGQRLRIPAGRYHRVARGESGIAIARAYGVDWSRIATLNRIEDGDVLHEGDRLLLPSAREVSVMSMEERARAFSVGIDDLVTGVEPALPKRAKRAPTAAAEATPGPPVAEPARSFAGRFAWPLNGPIVRPFGPLPTGARNDGINIAASSGTPIRAAADGVVAFAGPLAAFGQLVLLRHGGGWLSAYGHARRLLVQRGDAVTRGQVIAEVGATGAATEPQLHFEIRDGRKPVDPLARLPAQRSARAQIEIARVEAREPLQPAKVADLDPAGAEIDEPRLAELAQRAIDVDRRQRGRVGEIDLRDRQRIPGHVGEAHRLKPHAQLAEEVRQPRHRRAAVGGEPLAMDRGVDGGREPQHAREVRMPRGQLDQARVGEGRRLGGRQRDDMVIQRLQHEAVQVDEVARHMDGQDAAAAVRPLALAAHEAVDQKQAGIERNVRRRDLRARRVAAGGVRCHRERVAFLFRKPVRPPQSLDQRRDPRPVRLFRHHARSAPAEPTGAITDTCSRRPAMTCAETNFH